MPSVIMRTLIVNFLKAVWLYRPLKNLYDWIFYRSAKTVVSVLNATASLHTPSKGLTMGLQTLSEREILEHFLTRLEPGDVVWDVGANIGLYAVLSSRMVGSSGTVYCFEPEIHTSDMLRRNIALNAIENVRVQNCALGREDTTGMLFRSSTSNVGSHSMAQRDGEVAHKGAFINVRSGDSLVRSNELPKPDIVKIDVEGAEVEVIKGMREILRKRFPRVLLVEMHPDVIPLFGDSDKMVLNIMKESRYEVALRHQRGDQYHLLFEKSRQTRKRLHR